MYVCLCTYVYQSVVSLFSCLSVHLSVCILTCCESVHLSLCLSVFKCRMKEVLNQDPGEVAGMLKDPCYTRKELAKVLVTTKRRLEEAQNSRDAAWKEAVEAKEKVGSPQHCASSKEHHLFLLLLFMSSSHPSLRTLPHLLIPPLFLLTSSPSPPLSHL